MRRAIAAAAGLVLGLTLLAGTAVAQEEEDSPVTTETTTTTVLGTSTTNTTTTTTTTTTEPEETTTTLAPTSEAPTVSGDVVSRPLPRTGSDLNGTAIFGGILTVAGIALALGARRRRNAYEAG